MFVAEQNRAALSIRSDIQFRGRALVQAPYVTHRNRRLHTVARKNHGLRNQKNFARMNLLIPVLAAAGEGAILAEWSGPGR
jgi:hypothetical protein